MVNRPGHSPSSECREAASENLGRHVSRDPWRDGGFAESEGVGRGAMRCVEVTGWGPGSAALHRVNLAGSRGTTPKPPIFFST